MDYINDTSKPLVFVGSNYALYILAEACERIGIAVAGLVDNDYYGNTEAICDIPVIGDESFLQDTENKEKYNFFCATNWIPENTPVQNRNREKRLNLLKLMDKAMVSCITIIDPKANVSRHARINRGVFIDANASIEPKVVIEKYSTVMYNTIIGHNTVIGRNCVIQRGCYVTADCVLEDNVYISVAAKALKTGARFGENTFIQEGIYIRRSTVKDEIVSMQAANQKRLVYYIDTPGD